MKIGVLIDELAPGSAPKVIGQTCKGLERMGHECEAIVLINNNQRERFSKVYEYHLSGVRIRYIFDRRPWWDFKLPGFSFFSVHHIFSLFVIPFTIKYKEYNIVIANAQSSIFAAWSLKLFRSIPYIFYIHCDPYTYTLKRTYLKTWLMVFYPVMYIFGLCLDKFATDGARASIVSGRVHRERFSRLSKKPLENLRLGCFPKDDFIPYSQRKKAILTYDRWDIGNNPKIFLDLLMSIDKDIILEIGGFWHPEAIKDNFLKEVKQRKLENRIKLLGPLNEEMILELCSRIMLHLHPNEEAFGMQTLEAAACGCCIIIPEGSGVTDIFEDGIHGSFPQKDNLLELTRCVKAIFSDLEKAEKMGRKAWETASRYSWFRYARELDEIIKKYSNGDTA